MEVSSKTTTSVTLEVHLTRDEAVEISDAVCRQDFGKDPVLALLKRIERKIDEALVRGGPLKKKEVTK